MGQLGKAYFLNLSWLAARSDGEVDWSDGAEEDRALWGGVLGIKKREKTMV